METVECILKFKLACVHTAKDVFVTRIGHSERTVRRQFRIHTHKISETGQLGQPNDALPISVEKVRGPFHRITYRSSSRNSEKNSNAIGGQRYRGHLQGDSEAQLSLNTFPECSRVPSGVRKSSIISSLKAPQIPVVLFLRHSETCVKTKLCQHLCTYYRART